jgi:hypothetical protein
MRARPTPITAQQREMLLAYERLHAQWHAASEAAREAECRLVRTLRAHEESGSEAPDACELQRVLQLRFAADDLYREAMQVLRDAPL